MTLRVCLHQIFPPQQLPYRMEGSGYQEKEPDLHLITPPQNVQRLEKKILRKLVLLREAIKFHNRLNLGNHPNMGGGVSEKRVVSQPLTFAIITREKNHHLKRFFPNLCGVGWGDLGRLGWFPKFNRL